MTIDRTPRREAADTLTTMPADTLVDTPFASQDRAAAHGATPSDANRTPRRDAPTTLDDMAADTVDISGNSPLLSGDDIAFVGDDGKTYTLHTGEVLGAGAQGTVVRASDENGAQFAAKISWMQQGAKYRMHHEAVLAFLRSLMTDHPLRERHYTQTHLMPLFAIGTVEDATPAMGRTRYDVAIMPVCDNSLGSRDDVTFEELRTLILPQAASALKLLHENRIVHRDVKPKNLYLLDGSLVLGDFGISSVLDAKRDAGVTDVDRRTPGYSPHSSLVQCENDWYSLGYTVWTLYNGGRHPHQALIDAGDLGCVLAGGRPVPFAAKDPSHETLGELIFGLTYAFPIGRLGYDAVMQWCDDPTSFHYADPQPGDVVQPRARRAYQFEGAEYADRTSLADALCAKWERAKRHLYTHALEEYFRACGETDLAVALNDIVEMDKATIDDHDLGLCRALRLIDPSGPAFRWQGRAFELNGFAEFAEEAGEGCALAFLSSGALSRWARDAGVDDEALNAIRAVESDAKSQPGFALAFASMRFSHEDPKLGDATCADECFASLALTPAGFYLRVENDEAMHRVAGFLAALGHFPQAELFDRTLDEGGPMARAGRVLALFDEACADKDAVRRFNTEFGPFGHVTWMARNLDRYEARSETARSILAKIAATPDCSHMPVAQATDALAAAENDVLAARSRMAKSPYLARLGLSGPEEDVFGRDADAYFTAMFQNRIVPRGYMRAMADASEREPSAAELIRTLHVRTTMAGLREDAAEAASNAASRLRAEAAKQAEAKTSDGRKLPLAVLMIALTVAAVLLVAMCWPHVIMLLYAGNMEGNVGGFLSEPIARTSTLSVLAFAGFLVAACCSMSYRIADVATLGRNRGMANATQQLAARVEAEARAISAGSDDVTQLLMRGDATMPASLGIDAHMRSCESYTQGAARVRRGPCSVLFWAGIALSAACLFALTVGWLPSSTALELGLSRFDPSVLQAVYLAAAIAAFALAACWANKRKGMPGTFVMCLTPTAGVVAAYGLVLVVTIAVFALAIAIIVGVLYAIFN